MNDPATRVAGSERVFEGYLREGRTKAALRRKSDGVREECTLQRIPAKDGCKFRPIDDLKWIYQCEMMNAVQPDLETPADCSEANWPSALFCK